MADYILSHTATEIDTAITNMRNIINIVYPVGAIYISTNSINPSTYMGGTWTPIRGKFLLSEDSTYAAGSTGGEATHTLTTNEMPKHWHKFNRQQWYSADTITNSATNSIYSWRGSVTGATASYATSDSAADALKGVAGGGAAHNNMPPYLSVYMWERTA